MPVPEWVQPFVDLNGEGGVLMPLSFITDNPNESTKAACIYNVKWSGVPAPEHIVLVAVWYDGEKGEHQYAVRGQGDKCWCCNDTLK